jgi:hypothetical protein
MVFRPGLVQEDATRPVKKYHTIRKLDASEMGKNSGATIVSSRANDNSVPELWVYKPFIGNYGLINAAFEVYFGHLATVLFGTNNTPETKFAEDRGVVSRIIGDDVTKTTKMFWAAFERQILEPKPISKDVQKSLLNMLLYAILIGDRDIKLPNLILQFNTDTLDPSCAIKAYGIDREMALVEPDGDCISLQEYLLLLYKNPKDIVRPLFDSDFRWNRTLCRNDFPQPEITILPFVSDIDAQLFIDTLQEIVNVISANDFHVCYDSREAICKEMLNNLSGVYTADEVQRIIMPAIDDMIFKLKNNIQIVNEFLLGLHLDINVTNQSKLALA